jgi:PIN domain nuclease of toxin-antitoxin system
VNLFDASALLCFLENETGADAVERALEDGGACSAANWSETAQKIRSRGRDWELIRSLLLSYGLVIEPVTPDDAEAAARLWKRGSGLSLADRICLATGSRLNATVWTADTTWGSRSPIRQVR